MAKADLTAERLRELFSYDEKAGNFTRLSSAKAGRGRGYVVSASGTIAGTLHPLGYLCIYVDKRLYYAHRLAWLYVHGEWPKGQIDHVNGIRSDNGIANLRVVTPGENSQNQRKARAGSKSGLLGASWSTREQCWVAQITIRKKVLRIGKFSTPEEAHAAYLKEKRKLHPACTI